MNQIMTNTASMLAVRSFTQSRQQIDVARHHISTGMKVANALDSGAAFAIAQGIRSEITAWNAVKQGLGQASGLLKVSVASITQISNMLGELRGRVVEYDGADTAGKAIIQNDVNKMLERIDDFATNASFGGRNVVDTDQANTIAPQPPDEGTTFTLTGKGSSNTHNLLSNSGFFTLNFDASGGDKNIEVQLVYDSGTVDKYTVKKKDLPGSGALSFIYPAGSATSVDVVLSKGNGASTASYSFDLQTDPLDGVAGNTMFQTDVNGSSIDIQSRSHKAADLGLGSLNLDNPASALAALDAAMFEVSNNLGYYGAKLRDVHDAIDQADRLAATYTENLGALVDTDMGKENAKLTAAEIREQLTTEAMQMANSRPNVMLSLFTSPPGAT